MANGLLSQIANPDTATPLLQGMGLARQKQQDVQAQQQQEVMNQARQQQQAFQQQQFQAQQQQQKFSNDFTRIKTLNDLGLTDEAINLSEETFGEQANIDFSAFKERRGEFSKVLGTLNKTLTDPKIPDQQRGQLFNQQVAELTTAFPRLATQPGAKAVIEAGREAIPESTVTDTFAKINPKDFTSDSVRAFQEKGEKDFSLLVPTQESLDKSITGLDKFRAEDVLRNQFVSLSKDFTKVRDSAQRVKASSVKPSPAGDLSLIFNFMKILDPGSVVRESEFANAQTAQEFVERNGLSFGAMARVWQGEKLSDAARKDFVDRADTLFNKQQIQHDKRVGEYERISNNRGLDKRNVIVDLNVPTRQVSTKQQQVQTTTLTMPDGSTQTFDASGKRIQ